MDLRSEWPLSMRPYLDKNETDKHKDRQVESWPSSSLPLSLPPPLACPLLSLTQMIKQCLGSEGERDG